jgi:hypothetical protein
MNNDGMLHEGRMDTSRATGTGMKTGIDSGLSVYPLFSITGKYNML